MYKQYFCITFLYLLFIVCKGLAIFLCGKETTFFLSHKRKKYSFCFKFVLVMYKLVIAIKSDVISLILMVFILFLEPTNLKINYSALRCTTMLSILIIHNFL